MMPVHIYAERKVLTYVTTYPPEFHPFSLGLVLIRTVKSSQTTFFPYRYPRC